MYKYKSGLSKVGFRKTIYPGSKIHSSEYISGKLANNRTNKSDIKDKFFFTVKPRTSETSKEFIKFCLDNFSIGFTLLYQNLSNLKNK